MTTVILYFSSFLISFLIAPFNISLNFFAVFLITLTIYRKEWLFLFFNSILADIFFGGRFGFVFIALAVLLIAVFFSFKFISQRRAYFIFLSAFIAVIYPALAYFIKKLITEKQFILPNFLSLSVIFWSIILSYLIFTAIDRINLNSKLKF